MGLVSPRRPARYEQPWRPSPPLPALRLAVFFFFFSPRSSSEMSRPAYLEMGTNCSPALPRPSYPIYSHIYGQMAGGSEWEGCASQKISGGSERGKGVGTKGGGRKGKKKKALSKKVLDVLRNAVSPLGKYISVRRSLPAACTRPAPRPARISPAARQLRSAPPGAAPASGLGAVPQLFKFFFRE